MKKTKKEICKDCKRTKYLPDLVYGGIDGAVTTFAVVSGVIGASLGAHIILILGFANLFADGFSMAVSNYLSKNSDSDLGTKLKTTPLSSAIATFVAFLVVGFIPLLSFVIASVTQNNYFIENQFNFSIILTAIAFLLVGYFKGEVVGEHRIKSALQTLLIGGIAAIIAFAIGYGLKVGFGL
jgi:VIT1/CCC1 family predicted Fe2+/Mn2+ transporter